MSYMLLTSWIPGNFTKSTWQPRFLSKNQAKEGQNEPLNRNPVREELQCLDSGETDAPI